MFHFSKMFLQWKIFWLLVIVQLGEASKSGKMNRSVYYTPYQKTLPVLAKITPIDSKNSQVGETVTGYVYLDSRPPNNYPFYSVLCQKNMTGDYAQQIGQALNDINLQLKSILEIISSNNINQDKEATAKDEDDGFQPERSVNILEDSNSNVQSNIFQCDGVTCPKDSASCKITQNAIEPSYEKIMKTVLCLSSENKVLYKQEKELANPKKGSSLNTSQTINRNSGQLQQSINNDFEREMEKFKLNMMNEFQPMTNFG